MNCKNCGAPMNSGALTCPYCGYENEAAARAAHESELRGIYARIARLLHLPAERAARVSRIIVRGACVLIAVFVAALILSFIWSKVAPSVELKQQRETLEKMEAHYRDGDYAALGELVERTDNAYRAVYDKYTTVSFLYWDVVSLEQSAPETAGFVAGFPDGATLLDYELDRAFGILAECAALEQNGFVYGEQAAVEQFRSRASAVLTDTLLLTGEEIAQGAALAAEALADDYYHETDWSALRRLSAERLSGGAE